jgi:hypothetical protein
LTGANEQTRLSVAAGGTMAKKERAIMKTIHPAACILAASVAAVLALAGAGCEPSALESDRAVIRQDNVMHYRWLKRQVSPAEAEGESLVAGTSFGRLHDAWMRFIRQMQPGDQLWFYSNPAEQWAAKQGEEGYAIVRGNKVVTYLVTRGN